MSALRIAQPGHPATFIDLGPTHHVPLRGSTLRGRLCVPEPVAYKSVDSKAVARVRAFRLRHEGRVAS